MNHRCSARCRGLMAAAGALIVCATMIAVAQVRAREASEIQTAAGFTLTPNPARQGTVVAAWFPDQRAGLTVDCRFGGEQCKAYPVQGGYRALFGVDSTEPPGHYRLEAILRDSRGDVETRVAVLDVVPGSFPIQHLTISAKKLALFDAPQVAEEKKRIRAAVREGDPHQYWHGAFLQPVSGTITTHFAQRRYINGSKKATVHKGMDIAARMGTPVHADADGVVTLSDKMTIEGGMIVLDHGQDLVSLYYHLSRRDVVVGQHVKQGQVIGAVGSTGFSTGAHLHWSVYVNDVAVNPLQWVRAAEEFEQLIRVSVGGNMVSFPVAPMRKNGAVFVPARALAAAMGATYRITGTYTAELRRGRHTVEVTTAAASGKVDDRQVEFPGAPFVIGDQLMVPLRGVATALGYTIAWDAATETAVLQS